MHRILNDILDFIKDVNSITQSHKIQLLRENKIFVLGMMHNPCQVDFVQVQIITKIFTC